MADAEARRSQPPAEESPTGSRVSRPDDRRPRSSVQQRLQRWGTSAWWIVGIVVAAALVYTAAVSLSGLFVPLLLAAVLGMLSVPVVDRLEALRVPRRVSALLVILGLIGVLIGVNLVVADGLLNETVQIRAAVAQGVDTLDEWSADADVLPSGEDAADTAAEQGQPLLAGAATWATTVFSSAITFAIGTFLALFMLYYILVDWRIIRDWIARHLGVSEPLGAAIIDDASEVVRRGFGVLTLISVVTAAVVGAAMVALDVPLVLAVVAVTFIGSYVPYVGAIAASAFAFLIALGTVGIGDATVLLVVVILAQVLVQMILGNILATDRLRLHPLPSIVSTVCGIAIAGLLGAALSAPALAIAIAVSRRLKHPELVTGVDELAGGDTPTP